MAKKRPNVVFVQTGFSYGLFGGSVGEKVGGAQTRQKSQCEKSPRFTDGNFTILVPELTRMAMARSASQSTWLTCGRYIPNIYYSYF